jgi:hypothetical protein
MWRGNHLTPASSHHFKELDMKMKPDAMTHADVVDIVDTAISDSLDVDWTTEHAARAVVHALLTHGLLRIHSVPDASMDAMLDEVFVTALRRAGV